METVIVATAPRASYLYLPPPTLLHFTPFLPFHEQARISLFIPSLTKMKFSAFLFVILSCVSNALAATIVVTVGANSTNTFTPSNVTAAVGDTIAFQFVSKNHTATQSTFAQPCTQMTTPQLGIDSGFMPVNSSQNFVAQWSFTVNNASAPLWFYCRQVGHCMQGMVFAVNPTPEKSFAAFQAAAMGSGSASSSASATASPSGAGTTVSPSASAVTTSGHTNGVPSAWNLRHGALWLVVVGLASGIML